MLSAKVVTDRRWKRPGDEASTDARCDRRKQQHLFSPTPSGGSGSDACVRACIWAYARASSATARTSTDGDRPAQLPAVGCAPLSRWMSRRPRCHSIIARPSRAPRPRSCRRRQIFSTGTEVGLPFHMLHPTHHLPADRPDRLAKFTNRNRSDEVDASERG